MTGPLHRAPGIHQTLDDLLADSGVRAIWWRRGQPEPFFEVAEGADLDRVRELARSDPERIRQAARPYRCESCAFEISLPVSLCRSCEWAARALSAVGHGQGSAVIHFVRADSRALCGAFARLDPPLTDRLRDRKCLRCLTAISSLRNRLAAAAAP